MNDSSKPDKAVSREHPVLAVALALALALGGCGTMADIGEATTDGVSTVANAMNPFNWFGGDDAEADGRAKQESVASANTGANTGAAAQDEDRYPKLSSVPERPKEAKSKSASRERAELREGLVADTANAYYSDKELRAQTAPVARSGQPDLARSNERVAGEPPAQPAPTMPVASAPAAPLPAAPADAPERQTASAPSTPRAAPPAAVRPQTSGGGYGQRQAAAASAAPVIPVAPPSSAPSAAPGRQASLAQPAPEPPRSVLKTVQVATIYFNDGSARLSANDKRVIDKVAEVVRRTGGSLRIVGHSSMSAPSGDAERAAMINYEISLDRAKAVAEELRRSGVPGNQMQVMAEGARSPIYAETAPTGAAGNRRTEVYLDYQEQL